MVGKFSSKNSTIPIWLGRTFPTEMINVHNQVRREVIFADIIPTSYGLFSRKGEVGSVKREKRRRLRNYTI